MSVMTTPPRHAARYQLDSGLAHLTPADCAARGKDARAEVPREAHAEFDPPSDRPDPVGLLQEQAASRVQDLVPIRWGGCWCPRSRSSAGRRCRWPPTWPALRRPGWRCRLCGDAHLSNFGIFGVARAAPGIRCQRLRRDAARPVGVGCQAACGQPGGGGPGHGFSARGAARSSCAAVAVPAGDERLRREDATWMSGTRARTWISCRPSSRPAEEAAAEGDQQGPGQGKDPRQHAGRGEADPPGRRPAAVLS